MQMELAQAAVNLSRVFGQHIKVSLTIEGLDNGTIYQIAEYEGIDPYGSGSCKSLSIMQGNETFVIQNDGLPFGNDEVKQPFMTKDSRPF
jgi:hypothetical protein